MNKKIVLEILLLIFSTGTINLHASLAEKVALIRQKVKNSIEKVILKDAIGCTALALIGVALIVERRQRKIEVRNIYKAIQDQLLLINTLDNRLCELKEKVKGSIAQH